MTPGRSDQWVPLGVWTGKAPTSITERELDLFKIACHRRRARMSWVLRAFVLRTIISEFKEELRPEALEEMERTYRDLLAQQVQRTNTRKGSLKLHDKVEESVLRVLKLFKGGSVNVA